MGIPQITQVTCNLDAAFDIEKPPVSTAEVGKFSDRGQVVNILGFYLGCRQAILQLLNSVVIAQKEP